MSETQERKNDFSQGNVPRLIMKLAIPMIVAQIVNALYSIVDRIYIGHMAGVGQTALTGIGLCFPITMTVSGLRRPDRLRRRAAELPFSGAARGTSGRSRCWATASPP